MNSGKKRSVGGRGALATVAVTLGALALGACERQAPSMASPALVLAEPARAASADADQAHPYPVEVAARYANPMAFRVPGKLIERTVRLGDSVRKGQVVARLDPTDPQMQEAAAKAALEAAEHRLQFTQQQLERDTAQSAKNLIAARELEQTQDAFAAAKAAREQAADQWELAHHNAQYTTLVADHDGIITSENADTGQVVAAGQPIFGLAWAGDLDVTLDAAPSDIGALTVGEGAEVTLAALPAQRLEARVREISPSVDPQSRSYRVKLTLLHPSAAVRLGMTGEAWLQSRSRTGAAQQRIAIPATSIFHRGKDPAVWVIRPQDTTLELRPVTVALYGDRDVLVSAGLNAGETVVSAGAHTVYEGERVQITSKLAARDNASSDGPEGHPAAKEAAK